MLHRHDHLLRGGLLENEALVKREFKALSSAEIIELLPRLHATDRRFAVQAGCLTGGALLEYQNIKGDWVRCQNVSGGWAHRVTVITKDGPVIYYTNK